MKKLLALSFLGSSLLIGSNRALADINYVTNFNSETNNYELFKSTSFGSSQKLELLTTLSRSTGDMSGGWFDSSQEKFYFAEYDNSSGYSAPTGKTRIYDLNSDTWSLVTLENDSSDTDPHFSSLTFSSSVIKENSDGSIQIGSDANDIDITSEGMNVGGSNLIKKQSNGIISIGKNSFKMQETSSQMKLWATDSNGRIAPINITNGTKLLINGRDIEQSINNVGAMSAALTGLPTVPTNTTLACGLGTGSHGGDFAFSGGCASKVNEKLSINYAASMTMPGQDYAGDFEDTFSARAGFVWQLGKATKPTQMSMKEKENFKSKIESLEEKNNQLLARLERLEKIALGENKSNDLAVYNLK